MEEIPLYQILKENSVKLPVFRKFGNATKQYLKG